MTNPRIFCVTLWRSSEEENPEQTAAKLRKQRIALALKKPSTDQLRRCFGDFDLNSDGKLDLDEVRDGNSAEVFFFFFGFYV